MYSYDKKKLWHKKLSYGETGQLAICFLRLNVVNTLDRNYLVNLSLAENEDVLATLPLKGWI